MKCHKTQSLWFHITRQDPWPRTSDLLLYVQLVFYHPLILSSTNFIIHHLGILAHLQTLFEVTRAGKVLTTVDQPGDAAHDKHDGKCHNGVVHA